MTGLLLFLLACAPHHSSQPYKEPPTPKNQAVVIFAIEDGSGTPIDLSSVSKDGRRSTPDELRYITVDGRRDEAGGDDPRAPQITFETGQYTRATSWVQISMRNGRHTVQFPEVIRIGSDKYEVDQPVREVMFTDRAVEHVTLTPLPAIVRTIKRPGIVEGHFVLQKDDAEIPLDAEGILRPDPEDLGQYTLVWVPEHSTHTAYPGACRNIVRDASVPAAVSNQALCTDAGGRLRPECTCASMYDDELRISILSGVTMYQIVPKESPPPQPPPTTTVVFWSQAPSHVGDKIRIWYGAPIEVTVTYGLNPTLLEDDP